MMAHAHDHGHGRAEGTSDERRVWWAMLLTGGFMGLEVAGGLVANSLALLADAGHMLTDAASLALAWAAFRVARRPADSERSYGYHRFQVLAAFVNGAALIAIVGWIVYEAIRRLSEPLEVGGTVLLVIAALGLIVNGVCLWLLHGGDKENLNVRGAALHVLGDFFGSVAAIVAGVVVITTGWTPIDPLLSLLVAALVLRSAVKLVRQSGHILMEGTPAELEIPELRDTIRSALPEIEDVHHVHVWSLTPDRPLLTMHARLRAGADPDAALHRIKRVVAERFGIAHSTVQIEHGLCVDETEDLRHAAGHAHQPQA